MADLHVCATNSNGKLFHTMRRGDGSWLGFGDVEDQTGDIGFVTGVAVTLPDFSSDLHVCARTTDGKLFHTIRRGDGSWLGFLDVEDQTGDIGSVRGVAVTGFSGNLHVCATTSNGQLFHTIRLDDGSWLAFRDVEGAAGDIGSVSSVAVTAIAGDFDMCVTTSDGKLFHTMRRGDGSWLGFGDVEGQTGDIGSVFRVGLSRTKGGDLHVCATTSIGKLFHTIRRANGSWLGFRDVEDQAGDIGTVFRVAVTRVGAFDLHVCARGSDGKLFHTIRGADGSWLGFGDVEGKAGDIGFVEEIGATSAT